MKEEYEENWRVVYNRLGTEQWHVEMTMKIFTKEFLKEVGKFGKRIPASHLSLPYIATEAREYKFKKGIINKL